MGAEGAALPCPECGAVGAEIQRRTVAAVTRSALPPRQVLRLCKTQGCGLIYYGEAGARIQVSSLTLLPVFKGGDVLCFCFLHRAGAHGQPASGALEAIAERVRARECSCDLRNPSGKCCLGEIRASMAQAR